MTVFLIDPHLHEKNDFNISFSLLSLYSALENAGFDVKILNVFDYRKLVKMLNTSEVEFVGITTNTSKSLIRALEISRMVKEMDIPVFWGGPHATMLPEQTLSNRYIDGVVLGEGERTIVELAEKINTNSLKEVEGIMFKKDGKIIKCKKRSLIKNLDELPLPAWHQVKKFPRTTFFNGKRYGLIETSRGCPFRCGFCFKQFGNIWRYKSIDRVMEEIDYLLSFGVSCIHFIDDMFLLSKKRIIELCKRIIKDKKNISWVIRGARPDQVDLELLRWMKRAGCEYICFGVESGSQRILNMINKDISIRQINKAFNLCHRMGILPRGFFMVDFPSETKKDLNLTLRLIHKIQPTLCTFTYYIPFPNTPLYQKAIEYGFREPKTIRGWANIDMRFTPQGLSKIDTFTLKTIVKWTYYRYYLKPFFDKRRKENLLDAIKLTFKDFCDTAFLSMRG